MSNEMDRHEFDRMIQWASSDDLIRALAKRGAITRPVAGGFIKVSIRLKDESQIVASRRRRRQAATYEIPDDPDVRLGRRRAKP